ncbi:MAG: hypothetical protein ACRD9L_06785, partial [Bryobacteraceae bacterium]
RYVPWDLLVKDVPKEHHHDLDYLLSMLDWEANVDPEFAKHRLFHPRPVRGEKEMADAGNSEKWVVYSTPHYSAKELTVLPGRSVVIRDSVAYGTIVVQGWGQIGAMEVETPALIRFGEMTKDELFVSAAAAQAGIQITNRSSTENLVMLKHFGPGNPDSAGLIGSRKAA